MSFIKDFLIQNKKEIDEKHATELQQLDDQAKEFCKNKSNSLEDRLDVFLAGFGEENGWIVHWPGQWDDFFHDGDYMSRHETIEIGQLLERMSDTISYNRPSWMTDEAIVEFEEAILENWVKSYEFDW